jgi:hypothetical protein
MEQGVEREGSIEQGEERGRKRKFSSALRSLRESGEEVCCGEEDKDRTWKAQARQETEKFLD